MAQSAIATGANSSVSGESASINTVYTAQSIPQVTPANDAGITVPGSKVEQQFKVVTNFNAETDSHVLILRLAGETADNKPVEKAVTVKSKTKCIVCSHSNKSNCKFCSQCGTSLELF
jgi:hypothetical protein